MPFAAVNDVRLPYELADYTDPWRESPLLVLHQRFARDLEFWRAWVPLLARDGKVLRFDTRGCGKSTVPPPGAAYSFRQTVADAVAVLDHLGIERVHWPVEAAGGIVGLMLALQNPQQLLWASLGNTPFRLPQATNDLFVPAEIERLGMGYWARKTLVMARTGSKIAPTEATRAMQRRLPRAHLTLFEGYGQGIAFSIPERCTAEVRAFINSLSSR